jgi:hypothetical protein
VEKAIPSASLSLHFIDSHAKDKDIIITNFLGHLNVGTIKSTNGQCTVKLKINFKK